MENVLKSNKGLFLMTMAGISSAIMLYSGSRQPDAKDGIAFVASAAVPRNRVNYAAYAESGKVSAHLNRGQLETQDTYLWGLDHDKNGSVDEVIVLKNIGWGRYAIPDVYRELDKYNSTAPEPRTLEHYVRSSFPKDKCALITEFTQELTEEKQKHIQYLFDRSRGK